MTSSDPHSLIRRVPASKGRSVAHCALVINSSTRGLVLHQYTGASYDASMLLPIPGDNAASCTGITVGGFEISGSSYLAAINSVDHQLVTVYTDYTLEGLKGRQLGQLTAGVLGTGRIGRTTMSLLNGFGARVLGWDPVLVHQPSPGGVNEDSAIPHHAQGLPADDVVAVRGERTVEKDNVPRAPGGWSPP